MSIDDLPPGVRELVRDALQCLAHAEGTTIKELCNAFLNHKQALVNSGALSQRTWDAYKKACAHLDRHPGMERLIKDALRFADTAGNTLRLAETERTGPARMEVVAPEYKGESGLANLLGALTEAGIVPSAKNEAKQPGRCRKGRPKNTEKDSATKVIAALAAHHGYEDGSVINYEPATNRGLADKYNLSKNALSRFLTAKLGKNGHINYVTACRNGKIGTDLALWQGEMPGRLAALRPEENGRGEDDD